MLKGELKMEFVLRNSQLLSLDLCMGKLSKGLRNKQRKGLSDDKKKKKKQLLNYETIPEGLGVT